MPHPRPVLVACLLALLFLSGCGSPVMDQDHLGAREPEVVGELVAGRELRQEIWVEHNGLDHVTYMPATYARTNEGTLEVTLLDDAGREIAAERIPVASLVDNEPRTLRFPPQPGSAERRYTVRLRGDSPPGLAVTLWRDRVDRAPGALTLDGVPMAGDLVMQWGHSMTPAILLRHLARLLARDGATLLLGALAWLLPGAALVLWISPGRAWGIGELVGALLSLGAALQILLFQLTLLPGVRLGPLALWLLLLVAAAALALAWRRGRRIGLEPHAPGAIALYIVILVALVLSRIATLHSVAAPMWGDSLHHTLIVRLLQENGGIFATYLPYVPLGSYTYHSGFHMLATWLSWAVLPGQAPLAADRAVLLAGQLINVGAVVGVGMLAGGLARLRGGPRVGWAAAIALLVAGLLSPMPAFYINWGRYSQLAGQLFLPAALLWSLRAWAPGRPRRELALIVMVVAALALSHYRVIIMYAVAAPLLLAGAMWTSRVAGDYAKGVGRAVASALGVILLVLPWYSRLLGGRILGFAGGVVARGAEAGPALAATNEFAALRLYVPPWLLVTGLIAFGLLLLRRHPAALLGAWVALLAILANPATVGLPGTGLVNNFAVQIALYLPLGALVAVAAGEITHALPPRRATVAALVLAVLALDGMWLASDIARPTTHALLTTPDRVAAEWIRHEIPADAPIHINGYFAFSGTVAVGTDGGWWLWHSAERSTTIPPILYHQESGIEPGYIARVEAPLRRLLAAGSEPEPLARAMRAEGLDYLYLGTKQGRVGAAAGATPLDGARLAASGHFETLYHDGLVWLLRPVESGASAP